MRNSLPMHPTRWITPAIAAVVIRLTCHVPAPAAENPTPISASDLASRLSELRQNGASYVRLRMEINRATKQTLQLQIKERRTKNATEVVYHVLYPKERKGESVLVRQVGNRSASGSVFIPPNTLRTIDNAKDALLGSDLSYADVVENFFAWDQQILGGTEEVDAVKCQILESKPGKSEHSIYGSVRSWIDLRRMVPLRVEKYSSSGQLLRRIDTTRVVPDAGHPIPANLTVRGVRADSTTELDGSSIRHDVTFTDADFSEEGLKQLAAPRGAE